MAQDFFQINSFDHNFRHASRLVQSNAVKPYQDSLCRVYSLCKSNRYALFRAKMKMRYCFVVSWEDKTASGKRETFEFALLNSLTPRLGRI